MYHFIYSYTAKVAKQVILLTCAIGVLPPTSICSLKYTRQLIDGIHEATKQPEATISQTRSSCSCVIRQHQGGERDRSGLCRQLIADGPNSCRGLHNRSQTAGSQRRISVHNIKHPSYGSPTSIANDLMLLSGSTFQLGEGVAQFAFPHLSRQRRIKTD